MTDDSDFEDFDFYGEAELEPVKLKPFIISPPLSLSYPSGHAV